MRPVPAPSYSLRYRLCHLATHSWSLRVLYTLLISLLAISTQSRMATAQSSLNIEMSGAATSTGSTATVAEDDTIDWAISYQNISGGVMHNVTISNVLSGNQTFVLGSAQAPAGWVFDEASQTFSAPTVCPNNTATCGGAPIQAMGQAVNIGDTGGDGFAPVIHPSNGRIYNTYHNKRYTSGGIIQCVDTVLGSVCSGYPITLQSGDPSDNFPEETGVSTHAEHIRFEGDRYYYPVYRLNGSGTPEWGLGCFDVNSANAAQPGPCNGQQGRDQVGVNGFVRMGPQSGTTHGSSDFYNVIDGPWKINNKLYMFDFNEMQLHCYDPDTGQLCGAPYPQSIAHTNFPSVSGVQSNSYMPVAVEVLNDRLFIVMNYANVTNTSINDLRVRCWDTQSSNLCWGNTIPIIAPGHDTKRMNAFLRHNTSGDPDAICSVLFLPNQSYPGVGCTDLNGNAIASGSTTTRGVPNELLNRMNTLEFRTPPKELARNSRTYFPSENSGNAEGILCWDWTTNAFCSGFGSNGHLTDGTSTDTEDYGVSYDSATGCLWALGHTNRLWNFDANGNVPCQPGAGELQATVTPFSFFCSTGVGNVTWSWEDFQLYDMSLSDWLSLSVDIIAADGSTVLQIYDLKALGVTSVDISTIPAINLQGSLSFVLRGNTQTGIDLMSGGRQPQAFLNFASDTPGELCFQSQPYNGSCNGTATATSTAQALLPGGIIDDVASSVFDILPAGYTPAPLVTVAAVAASDHRTGTSTQLFQGEFDTGTWSGHLHALSMTDYGILQPATWDAAVVLDTQHWDGGRTILTRHAGTKAGIPFRWAELHATQQTLLDTDAAGTPDAQGTLRVQYHRGDPANEGPGLFRQRQHRLGAIVSSAPYSVGNPPFPDSMGNSYSQFRADLDGRAEMVYVGANDGMVHGFAANNGSEKLAYIPSPVMKQLSGMTDAGWTYSPTVDGPLTVHDAYATFGNTRCGTGTTCWRSVLVGGLGAGGQGIYALDVTQPLLFNEANAAQLLLWEFTDADDADLGDTRSQPSVTRMANNRWAVVIGNGYNSSTAPDGQVGSGAAVLYILFIDAGLDGAPWSIGTDVIKINTGVGTIANPNGMATPAPVDTDGDMTTDFIYAGDLHGNLWKVDVRSADPANWEIAGGGPLFTATDSGGTPQPITTRPEAGLHPYDTEGWLVYVGTGRFLEPAEANAPSGTQSIYALWDKPTNPPMLRTELVEQTVIAVVGNQRVTSDNLVDWSQNRGWYFELPVTNERLVVRPILRNEQLIFATMIPSGELCSTGGTSWLMTLDAVTGSRLSHPPLDRDNNGVIDDADRVTATVNGVSQPLPSSGMEFTDGVISMPVILQAGPVEQMYSNSTVGGAKRVGRHPGNGSKGRQAWRRLP